jgi:hypothetical protein
VPVSDADRWKSKLGARKAKMKHMGQTAAPVRPVLKTCVMFTPQGGVEICNK